MKRQLKETEKENEVLRNEAKAVLNQIRLTEIKSQETYKQLELAKQHEEEMVKKHALEIENLTKENCNFV